MIMNLLHRAKNISFNKKNSGLAATNVQDAIDELATDYIVEETIDGTETYRKWASGVAEYWGVANFNVPVADWASWGSVYYAKCTMEDISRIYPEGLFVNNEIIHNLSIASVSGNCWGVVAQNTASAVRPPSAYVYTVSKPASVFPVGIGIYAKGRWK